MSKAYFPLYTSDYLRDTRTLSTKAHGAYILLLLHLWDCDGEMQESPKVIQRVTGLTEGEYRTIWNKDLRPFFMLEKGVIRHKRVSLELARRAQILHKRCKSGAKGGRKSQEIQRERKANGQAAKPIGLASPFQGERPSLPGIIESSGLPASPPSPLEGVGDAAPMLPASTLPQSARDILAELRELNARGKVSLRDIDQFRRAVQGERAGRVLLVPAYEPPEAVAAIINRPFLKAIEGGKND